MKVETVIIGAGLSGLSCANQLEKERRYYLLVEKANRIGGRLGSVYQKDNIYDIIIIIKYNFHKVIPNKGSAIFIHVAEKKFAPTKGCIALKKEDLIQIINNLTKDEKILISF